MRKIIPTVLTLATLLTAPLAVAGPGKWSGHGTGVSWTHVSRPEAGRRLIIRTPAAPKFDFSRYVQRTELERYLPKGEFAALKEQFERTVGILEGQVSNTQELEKLYQQLQESQTALDQKVAELQSGALSEQDRTALNYLSGTLAGELQALEQLKNASRQTCAEYDLALSQTIEYFSADSADDSPDQQDDPQLRRTLADKLNKINEQGFLSAEEKMRQKAALLTEFLADAQKEAEKNAALEAKCRESLDAYQTAVTELYERMNHNLLRPKRFGDLEVFAGVEQTDLNSGASSGLVGARASYGNLWRAYFELAGFFDILKSRQAASTIPTSQSPETRNLERGYQETFSTQETERTAYQPLGEIGLGVTRKVELAPDWFLELSAAAKGYLGETIADTNTTRTSQLSRNGKNLGAQHQVSGTESQSRYSFSTVPTAGAGLCYKVPSLNNINGCLRLESGYDLQNEAPLGRAVLGVKF